MKNLYLIGNGFDKHHDIPSGYWDFHEWLKKNDSELVDQIDELYDYNGDLWGNFEVELGSLNVVEKATEIYQEHPADPMSDHYERSFHEGAIVAGDTIGEIYNKILEKFPDWIKQLPAANASKQITLQDNSYFITFNYTDTLIDLYEIAEKDILFIHGRAKNDRFLVLGHGKSEQQLVKEAEKDFDEDTEVAYIQTVQAIEQQLGKIRKKTEKIIAKYQPVFTSFKQVDSIYAYGLSMSEVDTPYFKEIISHIDTSKVKWHIDAFGKTADEISANGEKKIAYLVLLGVPKGLIDVSTLKDLQKFEDNPLF
jgi:hypothetical protein